MDKYIVIIICGRPAEEEWPELNIKMWVNEVDFTIPQFCVPHLIICVFALILYVIYPCEQILNALYTKPTQLISLGKP